jgi:hypothetical protein
MFWQVAQAGGGEAVGLEDGRVAEQDGDEDGQDNGEQPMVGGRGAVGLEGAADGVRGLKAWRLGGSAQSQSVEDSACRRSRGAAHSPTQRVKKEPDHSAPQVPPTGMPRIAGERGSGSAWAAVCAALEVECERTGRGVRASVGGADGTRANATATGNGLTTAGGGGADSGEQTRTVENEGRYRRALLSIRGVWALETGSFQLPLGSRAPWCNTRHVHSPMAGPLGQLLVHDRLNRV